MELNDEQFWQALRHALEVAEADEAQEIAAAERLLAETPVDPASRMSEQRIDEVVQFAIAPTADELAAAASGPREEDEENEQETPGRVIPISRPAAASATRPTWRKRVMAALPKPLAAAAAILLAPQFLAVAAVATAVVVGSAVLRHTKDTLGFQDAVSVLMQEDASEQARVASQGQLFVDLKDSIVLVQGVSREPSSVGPEATKVLDDLRRLLGQGGTFVLRSFAETPTQLGDQIADATLEPGIRTAALQRLGDELNYGVLALKTIEQSAAPQQLKVHNRIWLNLLNEALAN